MSKTANNKLPKTRHGFTILRDLTLLRSDVRYNPWQLGEGKWSDIVKEYNSNYDVDISKRTAKDRIDLLLLKYKKQILTTKTGSEEQETERGVLLQEISGFIEEASVPINDVFEAETILPLIDGFEIEESEILSVQEPPTNTQCNSKSANKKEADKERDEILNNIASEPTGIRRKRTYVSVEDEMIMKKQKHDMEMDLQRLEFEKEKLQLDKLREDRLAEDNRRKDEIAMTQIRMQTQIFEMMSVLLDKIKKD